jgi:hypothetical protein
LSSEFTIKRGPTQWDARIFSKNGEEVAEIMKGEGLEFKLIGQKDKREWVLTNKIDGEHRRFSFSVREAEKKDAKAGERRGKEEEKEAEEGNALLIVRDNIFMHKGKFYMLANHPEGKSWHNYINSPLFFLLEVYCIYRTFLLFLFPSLSLSFRLLVLAADLVL